MKPVDTMIHVAEAEQAAGSGMAAGGNVRSRQAFRGFPPAGLARYRGPKPSRDVAVPVQPKSKPGIAPKIAARKLKASRFFRPVFQLAREAGGFCFPSTLCPLVRPMSGP